MELKEAMQEVWIKGMKIKHFRLIYIFYQSSHPLPLSPNRALTQCLVKTLSSVDKTASLPPCFSVSPSDPHLSTRQPLGCYIVQCSAVQCSVVQCSVVQWILEPQFPHLYNIPLNKRYIYFCSVNYGQWGRFIVRNPNTLRPQGLNNLTIIYITNLFKSPFLYLS